MWLFFLEARRDNVVVDHKSLNLAQQEKADKCHAEISSDGGCAGIVFVDALTEKEYD